VNKGTARILNLLICAGIAVLFVAALADSGIPQPHGFERIFFWAGGPCALLWLAIEGFVAWSGWADDRHVRRMRARNGKP
jgi:hypothetical protein